MRGHATRRALLSAAPTIAALAAVPFTAQAEQPKDQRNDPRAYIEYVAGLHPKGRLAATKAMSLGLKPHDCMSVQLHDHHPGVDLPRLTFGEPEKSLVNVIVSPAELWVRDGVTF
ncbi:MAG: hypothetical protein JWQ97_294 [Phenylobacterium sp.]|nr:hypothetical protein [Phenylobacterium sp.]